MGQARTRLKTVQLGIAFEKRIFAINKLLNPINVILLVSYPQAGPENCEMVGSVAQ